MLNEYLIYDQLPKELTHGAYLSKLTILALILVYFKPGQLWTKLGIWTNTIMDTVHALPVVNHTETLSQAVRHLEVNIQPCF